VVGIGADGWAGLAPAARRAVLGAEVVLGSRRQLELLDVLDPDAGPGVSDASGGSDVSGAGRGAERVEWPSPLVAGLPALFERLAGRRVCALASGDPMFFGLGSTLSRVLGPDRIEVYPHPSSVSLACARLRWPVQEVTVLSAVGRPLDRLSVPRAAPLRPDPRSGVPRPGTAHRGGSRSHLFGPRRLCCGLRGIAWRFQDDTDLRLFDGFGLLH